MNKIFIGIALAGTVLVALIISSCTSAAKQSPGFVAQTLQEKAQSYVDAKKGVGIIIARVTPQGVEIASAGETKQGNKTKPTETTIFEIGSMTKALTGLLLAQAEIDGKINDQKPAKKYLKSLPLPAGPITVAEIASHSSGLPVADIEFIKHVADPMNPWKDFDKKALGSFLAKTKLEFKPGTKYLYSNIGAASLGYLLSDVYGQSYESLLKKEIFNPLGMVDSVEALSPEQMTRVAQGYINDGKKIAPMKLWDVGAIESAGAIRSTLKDLVKLAQALNGGSPTLSKAFSEASKVRNANADTPQRVGLLWHLVPDKNVAWHNGSTYGMESFIAINTETKTAVIILSNTCTFPTGEVGTTTLGGMLIGLKNH